MTPAIFTAAERAYMAACEKAGEAGRVFDAAVAVWRRSPPDTVAATWADVVAAADAFAAARNAAADAYVAAFTKPKTKDTAR